MSSASYKSDPRYAKAARLAVVATHLTVKKVMRAEGFNDMEVNDLTKQKRVRRMAARIPEVVAKSSASYKSDPHFATAARLIAHVPFLSVLKAIRAEGFNE